MYKNKEWLYNKYINEKLSSNEIGKECNVKHQTIIRMLRKHDIPVRSSGEGYHIKMGNHSHLSQEAIEWINGELLGDGCIEINSKYSAKFKYGSKYPEYIRYVRDALELFGIGKAGRVYKVYHKDMDCYSYHCFSRAYPELLTIHKQWYKEGKKIIPKDIKLTPLTCRQWYIGDGCLTILKHSKNIVLATYGFLVKDVEWLTEQLNKINIKANRQKKNAIYLSAYSVEDFLKYIGKCPIECYKYKWGY